MRRSSYTAQKILKNIPFERVTIFLQLSIIALLLFANLKQLPQQQIILSPLAYKNPVVLATINRTFTIPKVSPSNTPTSTITQVPTIKKKSLPPVVILPQPTTKPTIVPPTAMPTNTVNMTIDPLQQHLLDLLNGTRATVGSAPLRLDKTLSDCALSHAKAMAAKGSIYHDLANDVCDGSPYKGENVGMATGNGTEPLDTMHNMMVAEKDNPTQDPPPNHYTIMIDPKYTHVGLGIYFDGTTTWISEDLGSN